MEELKKIIKENNREIIQLQSEIEWRKNKIKALNAENEDCIRQILED